MKIKKIIPLMILGSISFMSSSVVASEVMGKVDLTKVTLFLKGAELQGTSKVVIPKGESEIVLTNLANTINVNSINVGMGDKAIILSTTLMDNYLIQKDESENLKSLQVSLVEIENEKAVLDIQLIAVDEEIALLQGNRIDAMTKATGSPDDAKQALVFVKENLITALTERRLIQQQLSDLETKINQYQSQISLEKGIGNQVQKAIKIKVYAQEATSLPVILSYLTPDAGWAPTYDVRVKNIGSPLNLTYKANVYQNSGLSWNNVDFILSTANPNEGITAPVPTPWYVNLKNEADFKTDSWFKNGSKSDNMRSSQTAMSGAMGELDQRKELSLARNYIVMSNNGINAQFSINLPYTINGYSKDNILTLKETEVPVEYRYIATPKLDNHAFLQAQVVDWDKLSLLPGKSTVFYNGNYIGESYITTQGIKDKLNISLGRDKEIIIARNQDINETSKPSFFGNDVSQKFAYTIDVRNTKDLPIDLTIYDQLPVIRNKVIALEDAKYLGANYEKETGLLTWQVNLKAKEIKVLPFSFKINYPKDKTDDIIGL